MRSRTHDIRFSVSQLSTTNAYMCLLLESVRNDRARQPSRLRGKHRVRIRVRSVVFVFVSIMIFVGFLFLKQHRKVELPIGNEAFYVISLDGVPESSQNNIGRFEAYEDRARRTCGEHLKWTRQPGYLSNRRGAGLTKSFVDVLQHAYANDIDFAYIFEDDAVMLNPLFCSSRFRHQMWLQAPQHLVLILAGHSVEASKHAMETKHFAFRNITKHYGSYAWCIRRKTLNFCASSGAYTFVATWKHSVLTLTSHVTFANFTRPLKVICCNFHNFFIIPRGSQTHG